MNDVHCMHFHFLFDGVASAAELSPEAAQLLGSVRK
jgi:hypothetical protein